MIYLDINATTPMLPQVNEALLPFLGARWGNPSSSCRFGSSLKSEILNRLPGTTVNGHPANRLANTTNIQFPGIESEALLLLLDQAGICASSGSACLADSPDPSHVIAAMKPGDTARQSIRFSLGAGISDADISKVITTLAEIAPALRSFGPEQD